MRREAVVDHAGPSALRPKLKDLVGDGAPQILLRIGHPVDAISATPRLDVQEVMEAAAVQSRTQGGSGPW